MKISKRKIIQVLTSILYNLNFVGIINANIYTGKLKKMCIMSLNCYSCPLATFACPLGSLQNFIMNNYNITQFFFNIPYYILGFLILCGTLLGRIICGFLCPFGLIQELLYKIKTKKFKKNNLTRKLTIIKYIILIFFIIIIPIFFHFPSFCKFICPVGTIEGGIPLLIINKSLRKIAKTLFMWKLSIAIILIIISIFLFRPFCRFICPLGAIYGFFNKFCLFGLKVDTNKCTNCNNCINHCLMDTKHIADRECIQCNECIKHCSFNAIYKESIYKKNTK